MILTPLPSANEDHFSSKINEEGADAKDKGDTNSGHSEHEQDIPKPRMTEHDQPTQGGTDSKAHQHKPSAHYEITSPGLRWTAHELRTESTQKTRKRYKKKKTNPSVPTTSRRIMMRMPINDSQDLLSIMQRLVLV